MYSYISSGMEEITFEKMVKEAFLFYLFSSAVDKSLGQSTYNVPTGSSRFQGQNTHPEQGMLWDT